MADHFHTVWPEFNRTAFKRAAGKNLEDLELKARSQQITEAMIRYLPQDFTQAAEVMLESLAPDDDSDLADATVTVEGIAGWAIMPMTEYVGLQGQAHFDLSMDVLKELTKRSSSEFGIRYFILANPKRALRIMKPWTKDPSRHVRRLVSEGTRPRLPWAMQLPCFIEDPAPVITLLEKLKDDDEEYVRRSVANNLNDIAKDHPDRVADIAEAWIENASKERQKLVRHACRTLIKQGHKKTMRALGYGAPAIKLKSLSVQTPEVIFGNALQFEITLTSMSKNDQPLIIDYIIHHRKANGSTSEKVFKWKTLTLPAGKTKRMERKHPMRPITTRVYYPGTHKIEIVINGKRYGNASFELEI